MIYSVCARFRPETSSEFLTILTDGTVANQKPDGPEIVASMNRARIDDAGCVRWSELCFCPTPLAHERTTVYDRFFSDMVVEETNAHVDIQGKPFMEYLQDGD